MILQQSSVTNIIPQECKIEMTVMDLAMDTVRLLAAQVLAIREFEQYQR